MSLSSVVAFRAEVSRLYHAFLFPQLGNEDDEVSTHTRNEWDIVGRLR